MLSDVVTENEKTLLDYLFGNVEQYDQRIITTQPIDQDKTLTFTYHAALEKANKMALYLSSLELPPKSQIAICSKKCVWWIITDLAIQMSGHETVPIFPTPIKDTIAYNLRHSNIRLLFIGKMDDVSYKELIDCFLLGTPIISFPLFLDTKYAGKTWEDIIGNLETEKSEGYGTTENINYSHSSRQSTGKYSCVSTAYNDVKHCISLKDDELQLTMPGRITEYCKIEATHDVTENGWKGMGDNGEIFKDGFLTITGLTKEIFSTSKGKYVAPTTEDGWKGMRDNGEIFKDGFLTITALTKEIFMTSKGKYVAPTSIESLLIKHPLVELAVVGGWGYPQPFAIIQLAEMPKNNIVENEVLSLHCCEDYSKELQIHLESIVNPSLERHERLQFLVIVHDKWTPENGFLTPTQKIEPSIIEKEYAPLFDGWCDMKQKVIWHGFDDANAAVCNRAAVSILEEQALTYHSVKVHKTSKFDDFVGIKFDEGIVAC